MANTTLKFGNGNWAIKEDSALAYSDQYDNYKPLPFDFSRASSGTIVNKEGLIESVNSGLPRIDFSDSVDGALLLEPQSTNLFPYSEDFSQWGSSNVSVLDNFTVSPSGTQNASKFTFNGTTNGRVEKDISVINGTQYTFSVWLKNDDLADPTQVWIGLSTSNQGEYVTVTNEWKRFTTTQVSNGTTEYPRIQTSEVGSIFAWGAQLEQSYATSYIPTQGSASTRVAETCDNSGSAQDFNSEEGVLYAEISALANDGGYRIISLNDGSSLNRIQMYYSNSLNRITVELKINNSTEIALDNTVSDATDMHKVAFKYKENDFALWIDGVEVDTDLVGSVFSEGTLTELDFNVGSNSLPFYGRTKDLKVYCKALTDEQLIELTTI